jgi:hypothetical protein
LFHNLIMSAWQKVTRLRKKATLLGRLFISEGQLNAFEGRVW